LWLWKIFCSFSRITPIYSVDLSDEAVKTTKGVVKKYGNPENNEIIKCDGALLPFRDNIFDKILLIDVIEHIRDERFKQLVIESHRILKNGKSLYIYTPNKNHIFEYLRKPPTGHIALKKTHYITDTLDNLNFTIVRQYYRESHIPIFKELEKFLSNFSKYFRKRICIEAIKK